MSVAVDRRQVAAFRLAGHHLDRRRPLGDLAAVAGAIGVRDVKGSGVVALNARLDGVTADVVDRALAGGVLASVVSARGVVTLVPTDDVAVFTIGTLPADEESLRVRLKPFLGALDASGHSATEALELARAVARDTLSRGPADVGVLSGALTRALPELSPMCRGRCRCEHIEVLLFDLVGESGVWRHEHENGRRLFVPVAEPDGPSGGDVDRWRQELVRRYLRCYGPSTAAQLADWCGIGRKDAARSLRLVPVTEVGGGAFLLTDDLERLERPRPATGARIIPPHDPLLAGRDRDGLVADRDAQRRIWRATPTDGVILADGEAVATWRTNKRGRHLTVVLEPVGSGALSSSALDALHGELTAFATLRGCSSAEVTIGPRPRRRR